VVLTPEADTWTVGEGWLAHTIRGKEESIRVTNRGEGAFLRFKLPELSGPVAAATLRLFRVRSEGVGEGTRYRALAVEDITWDEAKLVWANRPKTGATLAEFKSTRVPRIDVTKAVNAALRAGKGKVSFCLAGDAANTSGGWTYFASREGLARKRPKLILTLAAEKTKPGR